MSTHGPAARILIGSGLLCGLILALSSIVVLHGSSLVAVVVAAGLVACVVYGMHDDHRAAARAAAWRAAWWTVAISMLVAGALVLAGGAAAALVGVVIVAGGAVRLHRTRRDQPAGRDRYAGAPGAGAPAAAPAPLTGGLESAPAPVAVLSTSVLVSEWSRTTAALASRLEPAVRQAIVRRRHELLDELERRDPAGFARWLAAGAAGQSDPATFVRGDRATGSDAT
ncbi:MAG: conserved rane protein of unknown function [Modestobacter sp.]|nr:conserved rane protein of unknown function [Modestobacter sp.]